MNYIQNYDNENMNIEAAELKDILASQQTTIVLEENHDSEFEDDFEFEY